MTALEAEQALISDAQRLLQGVMSREGWSVAELADELGTTKSYVVYVLTGDPQNLTLRKLAHFAHAMGVRVTLTVLTPTG